MGYVSENLIKIQNFAFTKILFENAVCEMRRGDDLSNIPISVYTPM